MDRLRISEIEAEPLSNPCDIENWIILARLLESEEDDLPRAVAVLHQGIDACLSPSDKALLHREASWLLMVNNELQEAKREIEDALVHQPSDPFYWDQLILVGCRLGLYKEIIEKLSESSNCAHLV